MAIGLDTFVQMYAAKKAAEAQEEGMKDWQEQLDQLVAEYQASFDPIWTFVDPLADPGMGGITEDVLLSLGQPSGGAGLRGGPMSQAKSIQSAMGPDAELGSAARQLGYSSLKALKKAQEDWEAEQARFIEESEATRQAVREGRFAGYENLAQMLTDFPLPTRQGIEGERGLQEQAIYAEIARDRALEEQSILEAANAYGYNPAGQLGQLSDATTLLREQGRADAITRALQIITGEVDAAGGAIQGLQSGLLPATNAGLNLAQMRTGALTSMGQIAANQAMSVNNLQNARDAAGLMAKLGFPLEYMLGQNQANLYNTQGTIMGESLDVSRDISDWTSVVGAVGGMGGGGGGSGSQPYTSALQGGGGGGSTSGPATSGTGWGNYLSYESP